MPSYSAVRVIPADVSYRYSVDLQALVDPKGALDAWRDAGGDGLWVLLRRPVLLLFALGCGVSIEASGRFGVRLILDGMVSFAFVPIVEAGSLALVWRLNARPQPFAREVDLFFTSNAPWLAWLLEFMVFRAIGSPALAAAPPVPLLWSFVASALAVAAWAAYIDLQFFRAALAPAHPMRALIVQRGVAWTLAIVYFVGLALWPDLVGFVRG